MSLIDSIKNSIHGYQKGKIIRLDPVRNWLVLLAIALVGFINIIALNVWTFNRIANGHILNASSAETQATTTTPSFEEIENIIMSREEEVKKYQTNYKFRDPSL